VTPMVEPGLAERMSFGGSQKKLRDNTYRKNT
jgi:hypothetical protein